MTDQIKLINHSSILINTQDNNNLLTDPWYSGTAFNDGWSLLYENDKYNHKGFYSCEFLYLNFLFKLATT